MTLPRLQHFQNTVYGSSEFFLFRVKSVHKIPFFETSLWVAKSNIPSLFNNFLSNNFELILSFISTSRVTKASFRIIVSNSCGLELRYCIGTL